MWGNLIEAFQHKILKGSFGLQERVTINYFIFIYLWGLTTHKTFGQLIRLTLDYSLGGRRVPVEFFLKKTSRPGLQVQILLQSSRSGKEWIATVNNESKVDNKSSIVPRKKTAWETRWVVCGLTILVVHSSSQGSGEFDNLKTNFKGIYISTTKLEGTLPTTGHLGKA